MKHYTHAALIAALSLAAVGSSQAQLVSAPDGVDLGGGGYVYGGNFYPVGSVDSVSWTTPGFHPGLIAPVAQYTGVALDGSLVPVVDLIPLKTQSINIVDNAGNTYLTLDGKTQTITGPGAPSFTNQPEYIQTQTITTQPIQLVGQEINFGDQTIASSPGSASLFSFFGGGRLILQPGHTYRLSFNPGRFLTSDSAFPYPNAAFRFYNLTSGGYFGPMGRCELYPGLAKSEGHITTYITPTVATTVTLGVIEFTYGAMFGGAGLGPTLAVEALN